ncbi:MAG: HPr family phosphocarrier protein [Gammaproteobacteria bacterium]|nr:HPr family phosphocarrier protein [Gammaproteobacteria bacterium]
MIKQKIIIVNKLGLHARAAAKLVHLASRFESESKLVRGEKFVNGKSIMGVMMLAASKGTEIELWVEGPDENQAMTALCELINDRFGEGE